MNGDQKLQLGLAICLAATIIGVAWAIAWNDVTTTQIKYQFENAHPTILRK
jgi:hypothetical protein